MKSSDIKAKRMLRRKKHIRKRISGSDSRLRLSVKRSLNHIYAQIINDTDGKTLVASSTLDKGIKALLSSGMKKTEHSRLVGADLAKKAIENNIKKVAFDRSGYLYHGRVKALANAARENGLEF